MGGFAVGLVILAVFLNGKRTSCAYFPDARVMRDIRIKERIYAPRALEELHRANLDTSLVTEILHSGDIDFGRSNTDREPCNLYLVTGEVREQNLELLFENCDSIATLRKVWVK